MGYPTKVQLVNRKYSKQYYASIPLALAKALEIEKGEDIEWIVKAKKELILR